jgi:hypothetical protein
MVQRAQIPNNWIGPQRCHWPRRLGVGDLSGWRCCAGGNARAPGAAPGFTLPGLPLVGLLPSRRGPPPISSRPRRRDSSSPFGRSGSCSAPTQEKSSQSAIRPSQLVADRLHRSSTIRCSWSH